jgi:hypothetical protein
VPKLPLQIFICTPDQSSVTAQRCIDSCRATTAHIEHELIIADNHRQQPFSHPAAMNAALDAAPGYLVVADDDVVFSPGWLDSALDIIEGVPDVEVVGFTLYGPDDIWGSGIYSTPSGGVAQHKTHYAEPVCMPSQCSACWLIAPTKHRFDERYRKYRFEVAFCFEAWEQGKKIMVSPIALRHYNGTQFRSLVKDKERAEAVRNDTILYCDEWIKTKREEKILRNIAHYLPDDLTLSGKSRVPVVRTRPAEKPKQQANERRAVVVVAVGESYKTTLDLHRRYARKCNAELIIVDESWMGDEKTAHWLKWKCNTVQEMGFNRIAFFDGDTMPLPWAPDIFAAVQPGTLGVFDEAPVVGVWGLDRRNTCQKFVDAWNATQRDKITFEYTGQYWNSGVVVFDMKTNPFKLIDGRVLSFTTDLLQDQTFLNVFNSTTPKTWLDWRWNRMAIEQFSELYGLKDMFDQGPYILHFCGTDNHKALMADCMARVCPPAVERMPGPSLDGIRDWWRAAGNPASCIEIGCAHGESLWEATGIRPEMQCVAIDPWDTPRYGDQAYDDFQKRHGWDKKVAAIRDTSTRALPALAAGVYDAGYVDAMHDYDNAKADMLALLPKIRKGGVIGGHDYCQELWPGVVRAVNEIFGGPDMVFQDTSWMVRVK